MSRKSRRHGRHLSRSKRKKFRKGFSAPAQSSAAAPQPPVASQAQEAAPQPAVAPPVRAPAPRPAATPVQLPNVATELKMIGILSGIVVAILIALVFILP